MLQSCCSGALKGQCFEILSSLYWGLGTALLLIRPSTDVEQENSPRSAKSLGAMYPKP